MTQKAIQKQGLDKPQHSADDPPMSLIDRYLAPPIADLTDDDVRRVWRPLERRGDYDALEDAAMTAWQTAVLDQNLMKNVCAAPYVERATSD